MSLKNLSVAKKIPKLLRDKLKNKRVSQIYKKFEKSLNLDQDFIVAVSGGPDSLALAFLSSIYSIKKKIVSRYFIVDHKLRKNSSDEAKVVKQVLNKLLIKAEILTWKGRKPQRNIQSLARKKRYELLYKKCNEFEISNILLGHHQDDLFENFFLRILRGSGLRGLTSLDKKTKINNINLLRPLLDFKKKDLEFISKDVFGFYVQDPYNKDEKFQRIKVRRLIKELKLDGLDQRKFINTLNNLKSSNEVVKFYVDKNLNKNCYYLAKKNQLFLNSNFFQQPYEVVLRALSDSLRVVGTKYYAPRGKKLKKIIDEIKNNQLSKVTLGGCIIEKVNQTVIISKEQ